MGDTVIDMDAMTANVVLPEDLIAAKLTLAEPYCARLLPQNAMRLRQSATRDLRMVVYIRDLQGNTDPVKQAMGGFFLDKMVCTGIWSKQLAAVEGATYEEREKKYRDGERELFRKNADEWWLHRVQEHYDFLALGEEAMRKYAPKRTPGCLVPIIITLTGATGTAIWCLGR